MPAPTTPPPLAGLCTYREAAVNGLSVDATVGRLRRYLYLESQCCLLLAARLNGVPEWEAKGAFSLHLWQDAEHSTWFRRRVTEMRIPPHHLDAVPDPALEVFMRELGSARDTAELITGVYIVLKTAIVAAYREHLAQSHPIADYPTRRLLNFALAETIAQIEWGQAALDALRSQAEPSELDSRLAEWRHHLLAYLAAAGGIQGDQPNRATVLPRPRATTGETTTRTPARDERFQRVWHSRGVAPGADRPVHEHLWWMMGIRLNEMHVSELIATVMCEWRDQPWEFYHDLARHLWDETRHCMLGETAFVAQGIDFTQVPMHIGFADYPNTQLAPPERYNFLWGIEQGLMGKTGKQAEVALAKASGDVRATGFQDFDWADEVLHAQIGRRWLTPYFGAREAMQAGYERARASYDEIKMEDLRRPGRDWWPEFYGKYLKDKNPQVGSAQDKAPPGSLPSADAEAG